MTRSDPGEAGDARRAGPRGADPHARIATVLTATAAVGAGVAVLWLFSDVLLLLFAATLIACQLRGAGLVVARHTRLPYGVALALVVLAIAGAAGALSYWRGPRLIDEASTVYDQLNQQVLALWHRFADAAWLKRVADHVRAYLSDNGGTIGGTAASLVTATIGNLGSLLLIGVAAIYLAAAPATYRDGLVGLLPKGWRPRGAEILSQEGRTLQRWFVGQLVDMVAIGVMTSLGLWLLGIPLVLTLGLIAALCNFVPYLGALAGSLPAIAIALGRSPQLAVWVAALFVVVQLIEGNLISPLISKRTVDLPPVLTLFSQTVLGALFGPIGLILATPITAGGLVLVRMIWVETVLGEGDAA